MNEIGYFHFCMINYLFTYRKLAAGMNSIIVDREKNLILLASNTLDMSFLQRSIEQNPTVDGKQVVVSTEEAHHERASSSTIQAITARISGFMQNYRRRSSTYQAELSSSFLPMENTENPAPAPTGLERPIIAGESSSSMTLSTVTPTPQACINQYQKEECTPARQQARPWPGTSLRSLIGFSLNSSLRRRRRRCDAGDTPSACLRSTDTSACLQCTGHG